MAAVQSNEVYPTPSASARLANCGAASDKRFPLGLTKTLPTSELVSLVALGVACVSLCATLYFNLRDSARLKASSVYVPYWEETPAHIRISIVNAGRRPVILRMLVNAESKKKWVGTLLNKDNGGIRLGEHERYETKIERHELVQQTPDEEVAINDIWFEDTLGRKHAVKNAKLSLKQLRADQQ